MNDDTDSRPEPDDLNFPETLRVTIQPAEEAFDEAVAAVGAAEGGEQAPAVVSFELRAELRSFSTSTRRHAN